MSGATGMGKTPDSGGVSELSGAMVQAASDGLTGATAQATDHNGDGQVCMYYLNDPHAPHGVSIHFVDNRTPNYYVDSNGFIQVTLYGRVPGGGETPGY